MRNMLIAVLIGLLSFSLMVTDVQAKRFGGGKSFGTSRQAGSSSHANRNSTAQTQKPASGASKWLGPLAGFALGGLLATMFMGNGVGSGMLLWLGIAVLGFFIWRFLRSRIQPPAQTFSNANFQAQPVGNFADKSFGVLPDSSNRSMETSPSFFDEAAFLRQAKSSFIRLQAAYDNKNLPDIREFTSPQVFAEIQLQLQERGNQLNQTEVINLDAELIDRSDDAKMASVLFSGHIREEQNADPEFVKEIWHFEKNLFNSNWIVAGIQQDQDVV